MSRSVWKKFLSLEKFYTHIVADVADFYQVCKYILQFQTNTFCNLRQIHILASSHHRHDDIVMMIIRAGMELGQVLSEEQRKERFSSSMRRKRAAAQQVEKITLMKKS